ncbi:hypothetical protein BUALT_Bualt10G0074000 [Buddleja alternifolia]|uniref:F-box domain-containing protein n=1 Tax=Buddleja alternifolia TaxID=168488 RepID=A0AAV6X1G3_9LAMI|nr:hypothetical protein BUALT_Bualt10G0074000 [Buddleja alternifolia]
MEDQKSLQSGNEVSQFHLMDLPAVVLHVILFRLPINSIMNVKLVCRAFYKLISNPDFALNYSKNSPFASLLRRGYSKLPTFNLLEISDNDEGIRTICKPNIPGWSKTDSILYIVGTCNGLLCLSEYKCQCQTRIIYIWNPIMGECMALPEPKIKHGELSVVYGFGFCSSTNNYKVLRIFDKSRVEHVEGEGEILTIGVDDKWRVLDRVANPTIPITSASSNSVNLNDALHWLVNDNDSTWISTFDIGEEKIGRLSHPHGLVLNLCMMTSINNQLCLVDTSDLFKIVVWKMKKYGVAQSWTKDLVLDNSISPMMQLRWLSLVTILENGDMLFSHPKEDYTISYSTTKRELTRIKVPCFGSIDYSPNFLSLKEIITGGHLSTIKVLSK